MAAGQLKRKEPGSNEDLLLIRAMRDSNVPKVRRLRRELNVSWNIFGKIYVI